MARIPDEEIERLKKEISIERLVTGFGIELKRHGADLMGRARSTTTARRRWSSRRKPICGTAGQVQRGRLDHRLGDEDAGRQLPPCRRTAARRSSFFSRRCRPRGAPGHHGEAVARRSQRDADDQQSLRDVVEFLSRHAEAVAGSAAVSESRGLDASGDDRPLQAGLRQSQARAHAAGQEPQGGRGAARALAEARHPAARRGPRAHERLASCFRSSIARGRRARDVRAQDQRRTCGRARRCICTCRGRIAACGTKRRWWRRRKSFCASRSSTR